MKNHRSLIKFATPALLALSTLNPQLSTVLAAPTVTQVAAGWYHTLFIESDGSLWAMGRNDNGQLGDGTTTSRNVPEMIVSSNVVMVAAGLAHSLFVKSDGSLWAMGANGNGQLGDGTTTDQHSPEQIVFNGGVTAIAAGGAHSLFLKGNALWGMGLNDDGQLGNGTSCDIQGPTQLMSSNVYVIAAGYLHSLFVTTDGSVWAMGYNYFGELGDGTSTTSYTPVEILTNHSVFSGAIAVSAGYLHSLYLYAAPGHIISLWGMGDNLLGDLGDGTTTTRYSPEEILSSGVTAIAAGGGFSLLIESDGSLWAMGANQSGALGDGTSGDSSDVPEKIVPGNVTAIAAGYGHSLFIESDGSLWATGYNYFGQLGDGTTNNVDVPERIVPPPQLLISKINLSGMNLVLNGNNGFSGGSAVVLSSTNAATPLNQWRPIWTNGLGNGAFSLTATNAVNPAYPQQFYMLQFFQVE